ncbi:MAG: metallophosphoesterase [Bacteroidales bacterium]|nr:metallophosphoesterase [Bacteroidales bacterium]
MKRRTFIQSLMAAGLLGVADKVSASPLSRLARMADVSPQGTFDENKVVFISDLHTNPGGYQPDLLAKCIEQILQMRPLPRNVIALGDLAYLTGQPHEYARLQQLLKPFEGTGIRLTLAMGNHDRRENFRETFPEQAAKSKLDHRLTYIVETPHADIIVLDSLQQGEDTTTWITPGAIDEAQMKWLEETLKSYRKPVFVSSHHPIKETKVNKVMLECPFCCGYLYGHDHRWRKDWFIQNYSSTRLIPTLCMPSTGHWGDIGFVTFHIDKEQATARLHQTDFFFPHPMDESQPIPEQWKMMVEDHRNATCTFSLKP